MPIIDLPDASLGLTDEALIEMVNIRLTAVMVYPNDMQKRRNFAARCILDMAGITRFKGAPREEAESLARIGRHLGDKLLAIDGWESLAEMATQPQRFLTKRELDRGMLAGGALLHCLHNKCGINTYSRDLMEADFEIKLPFAHQQSIWEYVWKKMRTVAHLWAAIIILNDTKLSPAYYLRFEHYPGGVESFLAKADEYRSAGEMLKPPKGPNRPLLEPGESWRTHT